MYYMQDIGPLCIKARSQKHLPRSTNNRNIQSGHSVKRIIGYATFTVCTLYILSFM